MLAAAMKGHIGFITYNHTYDVSVERQGLRWKTCWGGPFAETEETHGLFLGGKT
jgi:hypothetical protein